MEVNPHAEKETRRRCSDSQPRSESVRKFTLLLILAVMSFSLEHSCVTYEVANLLTGTKLLA